MMYGFVFSTTCPVTKKYIKNEFHWFTTKSALFNFANSMIRIYGDQPDFVCDYVVPITKEKLQNI